MGTADKLPPAARNRIRRIAEYAAVRSFPDATDEQRVQLINAFDSRMQAQALEDRQAKFANRSGGTIPKVQIPVPTDKAAQVGKVALGFAPLAGGIAGAPGGLQGSIVGAGVAAAGADVVDQISEGIEARRNADPFDPNPPNPLAISPRRALTAGRDEGAAELVAGKVFNFIPGGIARFFRGDRKIAERVAKDMKDLEKFGVRPSLQDISNRSFVEGGRQILGGFPGFAGIFAKRQNKVLGAVRKETDAILKEAGAFGDVIPDTLLLQRLGERKGVEAVARTAEGILNNQFKLVDDAMKTFGDKQDKFWTEFKTLADRVGVNGNPANTRLRVAQAIRDYFPADATLKSGKQLAGGSEFERISKFVAEFAKDMPENVTISQLISFKKKINSQLGELEGTAEQISALGLIKQGLDEDIKLLASTSDELLPAYNKANAVSEEFLTFINDLMAKRVQRINKLAGRRPLETVGDTEAAKGIGSKDPIEILDEVQKARSPREVRQFFKVIKQHAGEAEGRRFIGRVVQKKLDDTFDSIIKSTAPKSDTDLFLPGKMLEKLGISELVDPKAIPSPKTLATQEMIKASGVSPDRLVRLSKTIDAAFSVKNPNVSQFIQRRAMLGGMTALVGAATGGLAGSSQGTAGTVVGIPTGALAFLLIGRGYSRFLTSPTAAKAVIAMSDSTLPNHTRARALVSLLTDDTLYTYESTPEGQKASKDVRTQMVNALNSSREARSKFIKELDMQRNPPTIGPPR